MSGLGSFVQGFQSGVDIRHKWNDRKRGQKQEDEDRAWTSQNREWATEDRGYTVEERKRKRGAEDRALAADAADRQAAADAYAATETATSTPRTRSVLPSAAADGGAPLVTANTGLSFGLPAKGDPMSQPLNRGVIPAPVAPTTETPPVAGPVPLATQNTAAPVAASYDDTQPGPTYDDWKGMSREERKGAGLPVSEIGAQLHFDRLSEGLGIKYEPPRVPRTGNDGPAGQRAPQPQEGSAQGDNRAVEAAAAEAAAPRSSEMKQGLSDLSALSTVSREGQTIDAGTGLPMAQTPPRSRSIIGAQEMAPATAPLAKPGMDPVAAASLADPALASQPGAPASTGVAVQLASATAPGKPAGRAAIGFNAPMRVTPEQKADATKSFMDNYMEVGVPKMIKHYLSTGDVEKAQAFDTWAKDAKVQKTMGLWADGVHAAAIGDENGMLDSFADYYNTFDDGLTVIRADSGMRRDKEGNIVGVKLTFRNDETGQTFSQELDGMEDLLQQGIYALAPDRMFEVLYGQMTAAQKVEADSAAADQAIVLAAMKESGGQAAPKRVADALESLRKNSFGFSELPIEKQVQMVMAQLAIEDQSVAAYNGGGAAPVGTDVPPYR